MHLEKPYALVGVNVIADTDEEARKLETSHQISFVDMFGGVRGVMQPPIDAIEHYWSTEEKFQAGQTMACSVVGSPQTVRSGLAKLVEETGADELMIVSDVFNTAMRLRSIELIAQAAA